MGPIWGGGGGANTNRPRLLLLSHHDLKLSAVHTHTAATQVVYPQAQLLSQALFLTSGASFVDLDGHRALENMFYWMCCPSALTCRLNDLLGCSTACRIQGRERTWTLVALAQDRVHVHWLELLHLRTVCLLIVLGRMRASERCKHLSVH